MKTIRRVSCFLFLTALLNVGQIAYGQGNSREINKVFPIDKGEVLEIENKFGNIDILHWEKPEASVTISLSANAINEETATSLLKKINVKITKENSIIRAETVLNDEPGFGPGNQFAINYTVYVPKWANLSLVNKYGNISIEEISGLVNIELKYGYLRIKSLSRGNLNPLNEINMDYSNGVIENAGFIKLNLSISKLDIEDAESIIADTKYSSLNVSDCKSFRSISKYDHFKFENIRNLEGNLKYSNLQIGEFSGKLDVESSYTGVKIAQVLPSFEFIKIINSRGAYKIGIDPVSSFDLVGNSNNGEIHTGEFKILEKKLEGNSKFIRASNGIEGTGKVINIVVEEGSVNLFKNSNKVDNHKD